MRIDDIVNEVGDTPYKPLIQSNRREKYIAIFTTSTGARMEISITSLPHNPDSAEVGFYDNSDSKNPTIDVTGKGDAFKVFSTVGAVLKDYIKKFNPSEVTFSGNTKDSGRIKLYDMIAKHIGKYLPNYQRVHYPSKTVAKEPATNKFGFQKNKQEVEKIPGDVLFGDKFYKFVRVGEGIDDVDSIYGRYNVKPVQKIDRIPRTKTRYNEIPKQQPSAIVSISPEARKKYKDEKDKLGEVAKVHISRDPNNLGATVRDQGKAEPTVQIPISKISVLEPDEKFDDPKYAKNLSNLVKALKAGEELPPIIVHRQGIGKYELLDGHHRFKAYRMLDKKFIPARIVDPANVTESLGEAKKPKKPKTIIDGAMKTLMNKGRSEDEAIADLKKEIDKKFYSESILDERKMADLYHATDIDNLVAILRTGQLIPGRNEDVSLTRDKNYNYAAIAADETAVFVIDQAKLAFNRKIEPYDFHMDTDYDNDPEAWARDPDYLRRSESQERVKGPINLKYVKAIILPSSYKKKRNILQAIQQKGIEIKFSGLTEAIDDDWFKDGFKTYKNPAPVKYQTADKDGVLQTLEGPVKYSAGYKIMTGPKGEQYPIPPEKFEELYDVDQDGTATPKKIIKLAKLADHDGVVNTSWGEPLNYTAGNDYIVRHGANDYGVVKKDIFAKTYVQENFADGKGPGRPGDSQRHGIPKKATMAELEKASHAKGRKGQLARWQLNMRRGKKKASESTVDESIFTYRADQPEVEPYKTKKKDEEHPLYSGVTFFDGPAFYTGHLKDAIEKKERNVRLSYVEDILRKANRQQNKKISNMDPDTSFVIVKKNTLDGVAVNKIKQPNGFIKYNVKTYHPTLIVYPHQEKIYVESLGSSMEVIYV